MYRSPSPSLSFTSKSSEETDDTSNSSSFFNNTFDDRKLRLGDSYFQELDYERAEYYYLKHLGKAKKFYAANDERVILAYEKVGDAQVMINKKTEGIGNYRMAINELRAKIKSHAEKCDEIEYAKVKKRFCRVLINCGNALVQIGKEFNEKTSLSIDYFKDAIECYEEALPIVQETYGLSHEVSIDLTQRFSIARENLATIFSKEQRINMAKGQYDEIIKNLKPLMQDFRDHSGELKSGLEKYYTSTQYLFLKYNINLGLILLEQEQFDSLLHIFEEAFSLICLSIDIVDEQRLQQMNDKTKQLIVNISHNMGVVCQKKGLPEKGVIHFQRVMLLKRERGEDVSVFTILGLGHAYFNLQQYDKALPNLLTAKNTLDSDEENRYDEAYEKCLSNIALIYEIKKEYSSSLKYLERLSRYITKEKESHTFSLKCASYWFRMGKIYFLLENFEQALNLHLKALEIRRREGNDAEISLSLRYIGQVYASLSNHLMAFEYFEDSLEYSQEDTKVEILFQMGKSMSSYGYVTDAMDCFDTCLTLALSLDITNMNLDTIVTCVSYFSRLLVQADDHNQAIIKCESVLAAMKKISKVTLPKIILLLELGNVYTNLRNMDMVLRNVNDALEILKKHQEHIEYFVLKSNFMKALSMLEELKKYDLAIDVLRELKDISKRKLLDENEREIEQVSIMQKIAQIQQQNENFDGALESYEAILLIEQKMYGKSRYSNFSTEDLSITYCHLGDIYVKKKLYQDALFYYDKAMDDKNLFMKASTLCKIGEVLVSLKYEKKALKKFQKALTLVEKNPAADNDNILSRILHCIGSLLVMLDKFDEALHYFERARLSSKKVYVQYNEECSLCFSEAQYDLCTHVEALHLFQSYKKTLNYDDFLLTFDGFEDLHHRMLQIFSSQNDYDSCIICIKAYIDLASLFLNDEFLYAKKVSKSLLTISAIHAKFLRYDDAIKSLEIALTILKLRDTRNICESSVHQSIAEIYLKQKKYQVALNHYREALKLVKDKEKISLLDKIAIVLWKMQRLTDANEVYRSALLLCERHYPEHRIIMLNNLGNVNMCSSKFDEALSCYLLALSTQATRKNFEIDMKHIILNIGLIFIKQKCYENALTSFVMFLSSCFKDSSIKTEPLDSNLASVLNLIGYVLIKRGKYEESQGWFENSIQLLNSLPRKNFDQIAGTMSNLALSFSSLHSYESASYYLFKAIDTIKGTKTINETLLASFYDKYANIKIKTKDYESALTNYEKSLALKRKCSCPKVEELDTLHNIALIYCKKKDFHRALDELSKVLELKITSYGDLHVEIVKAQIDIGMVYLKLNALDKAEINFKFALKALKQLNISPYHPYQKQLKSAMKAFSKSKGQ